jgi:hypothetical protein
VVDCTGLENRQRATVREFESHRFRQRSCSTLQRWEDTHIAQQCDVAAKTGNGQPFVSSNLTASARGLVQRFSVGEALILRSNVM